MEKKRTRDAQGCSHEGTADLKTRAAPAPLTQTVLEPRDVCTRRPGRGWGVMWCRCFGKPFGSFLSYTCTHCTAQPFGFEATVQEKGERPRRATWGSVARPGRLLIWAHVMVLGCWDEPYIRPRHAPQSACPSPSAAPSVRSRSLR